VWSLEIFLKYFLDFSNILHAVAMFASSLFVILCPFFITSKMSITRLCNFGWIVPQAVVIWAFCSFVLRTIFLNIDYQIALVIFSGISLLFLLVENFGLWAIRKTLVGTVDNTLLATFFGMLWNGNLEGIRFLSFVSLILKAIEGKWNSSSTALVLGSLLSNLLSNIWTLGGLRFLLTPMVAPCCYNQESVMFHKAYYSARTVTEYTAPLVWLIFAFGMPFGNQLSFPTEVDEEMDARMLAYWRLCRKHAFIICSIYLGCEVVFDYSSYRISRLHQTLMSASVYNLNPWFLIELGVLNGFYLIGTYKTFSIVSEHLLNEAISEMP